MIFFVLYFFLRDRFVGDRELGVINSLCFIIVRVLLLVGGGVKWVLENCLGRFCRRGCRWGRWVWIGVVIGFL